MIAIIGSGNVASHLYEALKDKTDVVIINPHTLEGLPSKVDIFLIAVADSAIRQVAERLPVTMDALVAHTAGSVSMDILDSVSLSYGVFYPLQTFSKNLILNYKEIPVFIEGNNSEAIKKLKNLASLFSDKIFEADSEKRKQLHLASVFACNFTNALMGVADELLRQSDFDFSVVLPLLSQTVKKLETLSPEQAQTGPASRGDTSVLADHLNMLDKFPEYQQIYKIISDIIVSKRLQNIQK